MYDSDGYNYQRFTAASWRGGASAFARGHEPFPELVLRDADNHVFRLSELRGKTVVLETGSLTCPLYVRNIGAMAALKERFPAAVFLVLYVREEHPGRRLRAHRHLEDKRALARQLYSEENEHRRVIVDDLEGSAHQALGGLPNMACVIGADGVLTHLADWNDPMQLERVLSGETDKANVAAPLPPRPSPWLSLQVLARAGGDAFLDFLRASPSLLAERRGVQRGLPASSS